MTVFSGVASNGTTADLMAFSQVAGVHRTTHREAHWTNGAPPRNRLRRGVPAVRRDVVNNHPPVFAQASRDLGVAQERRRLLVEAFDYG
jgi:hypothetical protein